MPRARDVRAARLIRGTRGVRDTRGVRAVALSMGLLAALAGLRAAPGDLIEILPSEAVGPVDLAHDGEDDTWWVTSHMDHVVYHYSRDLREVLGTIPVPFESIVFSGTTGIAVDDLDRTLWIAEVFGKRLHEIRKDGTPTGRVCAFDRDPAYGIAFHRGGDGGRGSLYCAFIESPQVEERSLDGALLRSFPSPEEVARVFGPDAAIAFNDIDPIVDAAGALTGFHVLYHVRGAYAIATMSADGRFVGGILPLLQAAGEVDGLVRRPFPHPETGAPLDAFVCSTIVGSRFAVFEAGAPGFQDLRSLGCRSQGRTVELTWIRGQAYDAIHVLHGCEVLETLPGDADGWTRDLPVDGVYSLGARGVSGPESTEAGPCEVVVGAGHALRSREDIPDWKSYPTKFLAADAAGRLIVADGAVLRYFDATFAQVGESTISSFFLAERADGGGTEGLGGIARGFVPGTLFAYNADRDLVGLLDEAGGLIDGFEALLPEDVVVFGEPPRTPGVLGLASDPRGDAGRGTLWALDETGRLHELLLSGRVLRSLPHPFLAFEGTRSHVGVVSGLSLVEGAARREVCLTGILPGFVDSLFRFDVDRGEIVPGSIVPLTRPFPDDFEHVLAGGSPRLFASTSKGLEELSLDPPSLAPPLACIARQPAFEDAVEVLFPFHPGYDAVEVRRDCSAVFELDGAAERFVDPDAGPGLHEYAVRGRKGALSTVWRTARVRVGTGAILGRTSTEAFPYPAQIARNPVDGSFFVTTGAGGEEQRRVARFDADLRPVEQLELDQGSWTVKTLAVRVGPDGEPLLYYIVSTSGAFRLVAETMDHAILFDEEILPPDPVFPNPVGLTWDPATDTFYYLEGRTDTIVQIDASGKTLRTFPHPAPPPTHLVANEGLSIVPGRGTLLATTVALEDLEERVPGCGAPCTMVARAVEIRPDGTLTGHAILFDRGDVSPRGIVALGRELVAASSRYPGQLVRIKAFETGPTPEPPPFVRADANADGRVNLSDAVAALGFLFLGQAWPDCLDSADANDSGRVDITDPVYLLNHLFLGGPPVAEPAEACGADPTHDDLPCERFEPCRP